MIISKGYSFYSLSMTINLKRNMTQKTYTPKDILNCLKLLCKKFPKAFDIHHPKPLKLFIHKDIQRILKKEKIDENILQITLKIYSGKPKYLQATIDGRYRVNLYGFEGRKVQNKHKAYAKQKLEELKQAEKK